MPNDRSITGYQVMWGFHKWIPCAKSPCTVSHLLSGSRYSFVVRAINRSGGGPWSAASNAVTPLPPPTYKVPLSTLCRLPGSNDYICGTDYSGTIQVGGELFQYVDQTNGFSGAEPPYWDLLVSDPANTCFSLTIQYASPDQVSNVGQNSSVQLLQVGVPAVQSTTARGTVGTLTADLNGSPFTLEGNSSDGEQVFADGYALCHTVSGT